ncbi:peptidoglycan DD-metalloendopeptidase family protein [Robiginitalea sp. IMCC44478]|uniref:peptidoglycan DD-metalloendopeptidase family protein n=1 Tax=Robiginitalea sp. IMCC44478 TaxID=3459122 RepID=UPI004040FFD1
MFRTPIFILVIFICTFLACDRPTGIKKLASKNLVEEAFREKILWQQENEPEAYRNFVEEYKSLFNENRIEAIFDRASSSLLNRTPRERLESFLSTIRKDYGQIDSIRFKYFDKKYQRRNATYLAVYYVQYQYATADLRIGLNDSLQLDKTILVDNNFNEDLPLFKNQTALNLPFEKGEEWYVLWGGDTEDLNYHVTSRAQKNAFDFIIRHPFNHKSFQGNGEANTDYYAFNRRILTPCSGKVVTVVNDVKDNIPGTRNPEQLTGNSVIIETEAGEYLLLAHLKKGSIQVNVNEQLHAGQYIGLVGNSGNSTEPHLHMHLMDEKDMERAAGIKMYFNDLIIDGVSEARNYSPIRTNRVMHK